MARGGKSIASLYIDLLLKTGDLLPEVKETTRKLADEIAKQGSPNISKSIKKLKKSSNRDLVDSFTVRAGEILAFNELGEAIKRTADNLKELQQNAQMLSFPISDFQTLTIAAKQSGVSIEQLQQGIQNMQQVIAEAAEGNPQDRQLFSKLGLDPDQLARENATKQFDDVADALKNVQNAAERSNDAIQLFSYYGGNLVNVADKGSKSLDRLAGSLAKQNILITPEDADNFQKLNSSLEVFQGKISAGFEKALAGVADTIFESSENTKDFEDVLFKTDSAVITFAQDLMFLGQIIDKDIVNPLDEAITKLKEYGDTQAQLHKDRLAEQFKQNAIRMHPHESGTALDPATQGVRLNRFGDRGPQDFTTSGRITDSASAANQKFGDLHNHIKQVSNDFPTAQSNMQGFFDNMNDDLNHSLKTWQDWADLLLEQFDKIVNAINTGMDPAMDNLKQSGIAAQSAFGKLFGSGGGAGASYGGLASAFASAFGGSFANGGIAPGGKVSLVGEKGPEFIAPRSSMVVTPAQNMIGAGGAVHVQQTFTGGVSHSQLREEAANIKRQTMQAVLDASRRGGNYRRGLHQ